MAKHTGTVIPVADKRIVEDKGIFYLELNGKRVAALFARTREGLEKFIQIFEKKLDDFAHREPNHSILYQLEGRHHGQQQSTRKRWADEFGVFMDYPESCK